MEVDIWMEVGHRLAHPLGIPPAAVVSAVLTTAPPSKGVQGTVEIAALTSTSIVEQVRTLRIEQGVGEVSEGESGVHQESDLS